MRRVSSGCHRLGMTFSNNHATTNAEPNKASATIGLISIAKNIAEV